MKLNIISFQAVHLELFVRKSTDLVNLNDMGTTNVIHCTVGVYMRS
jgi:hypothetical protein